MSAISLSPALQQALSTELFNTLSSSMSYTSGSPNSYDPKQSGLYGFYYFASAYNTGYQFSTFRLFQGTVPANIAAVDQGERDSDVLISWTADQLTFTNTNGGTQITGSSLKNPSANGTATWFMWGLLNGVTYHRLIGTVGLVDSGADLELNNTVLETATQYRIFGTLNVNVPTEFTY